VRAFRGANEDVAIDRTAFVVADLTMRHVLERSSVRVGCCVSQVFVDMKCEGWIVRAYRVVNEDVAVECSV